jgi:hypothetical protein
MLVAEFTFALSLQGRAIREYVATDPVSRSAYLFALGLFAIMPVWV